MGPMGLARDNTTIDSAADVTTSALLSDGIHLDGTGNSLTNSGTITTGGAYASGIYSADGTSTAYNTITIAAGGKIVTSGQESFGVNLGEYAQLTIDGADATAGTAAGSVATYGAGAHGISAAYDPTIDNVGDIATTNDYAYGINLFGTGNVLTHAGTISTDGDSSRQIYTPSGTDITIEAGGQIITAGSTAYGIYLGYAQLTIDGADATAGTAAGSIATYGAGAHGISAAYDTTIDNAGDITTSGNSASGIYLSGTGNTLTHSGTITTGGDTGYEIYAAAGTSSSYNAIAIEAGGKIITTGENAYGIYLGDYGVLTIAAADTVNGLVAGSITTGNSTDSSIGVG